MRSEIDMVARPEFLIVLLIVGYVQGGLADQWMLDIDNNVDSRCFIDSDPLDTSSAVHLRSAA
jgi:hypothetical protein